MAIEYRISNETLTTVVQLPVPSCMIHGAKIRYERNSDIDCNYCYKQIINVVSGGGLS